MPIEKRTVWRVFGLALVMGGMSYLYFVPQKSIFLPDYQRYIPSPTKCFLGLIGYWILSELYRNRAAASERLQRGLSTLFIGIIVSLTFYISSVAIVEALSGATWHSLFSSLIARHSSEFNSANYTGFVVAGFALLCTAIATCVVIFGDSGPRQSGYHQRGRQLISYEYAQSIALQRKGENEPGILWGMLNLPSAVSTTHFLVTGATGSGKTITLRLLMQSVLPRIGWGEDCRALIYDAKQDMLSILAGMNLGCRVVTLNPFDKRCAAWDIAKDVTGPATAQQAASILIPENNQESQPFFSDASRHLLTGVLVTFLKTAPGRWTLRDVVLAMRSKERLKEVLSVLAETKDLLEYFANDYAAQNILSTLQSRMQRYEFIAAAWEHATERVSLKEWLEGEFVLVLGNDEATRTALDAINQVIFKRLTELILALPESTTRRNWVFLDEVREAGKLDGLGRLLTKGRSKGACVVLGLQDIDGLRDVYGREVAHEIVGLCSNKAILRTDSPGTAEWASRLFGEREVLEIRRTRSENEGESKQPGQWSAGSSSGISNSEQEQLSKREVVLSSQFMDMLPTNPTNGLSGYYLIPTIGAYFARISGESIARELLPADESVPNVEPRLESEQYLSAWTDEDFRRLGLPTKKAISENIEKENTGENALQLSLESPELGFLAQIKRE